MAMGWPAASVSTSIAGCSRSRRVIGPVPDVAQVDRAPRPARLGERRLGIEQGDPPDPILPERQGEPRQLPAQPRVAGGLRHEQRELLTGRRPRPGQLQVQARDRGRRRRRAPGGRTAGARWPRRRRSVRGSAARRSARAGVPARANARSSSRRRCARVAARPRAEQLAGERAGQPMEDEPQRLELLRRRLDGESQGESFGGPARPERIDLLAAGPGVEPRALLPEAGDERRPGEFRHGPDPAQAEAGEPGPDVGVLGEQAGRVRGEERGLAAGRDDDRPARAGVDRGDGRGEAGPGDAGTDRGAGRPAPAGLVGERTRSAAR